MHGGAIVAVGNHYILTLQGQDARNGQQIDNVFCYEQTAGTGDASELVFQFGEEVYAPIMNILSVYWVPIQIVAYNLEVPTDYATRVTSVTGTVTGEAEPSFVGFAFEYVRTSRVFNNGRKTFGPIAQADVLQNGPSDDALTRLEALATELNSPIEDIGTGSSWVPRIWRRPGTYASGVVAAPGAFNAPQAVIFRRVSSQNTRKTGRGS